jgi:predicted ester cyclase
MIEQNRALALRWFEEVWNKGNLAAIDELFLPEGLCYGFPDPLGSVTREQYDASARAFHATFSDIHVTVDGTICERDEVSTRWTATMKHTGSGLGFPPTGKLATLAGQTVMQIRDGRILYAWSAHDLTKLMNDLHERDILPPTTSS